MGVDSAFLLTVALPLIGLTLSVALERLLKPQPAITRPYTAWLTHTGLFLLTFALLTLLSARPWCSITATLGILITLILVSNAKMHSLKEPFVAQDYEYFIDTIMHPRFFLPFLGVKNFVLAALGFALALVGFLYEATPAERFLWNGQGGALGLLLVLGACCLFYAQSHPLQMSFDPQKDMQNVGLLASIWGYALAMRHLPHVQASPFTSYTKPAVIRPTLPHLVAIQSESFFDPRPLHQGIKDDVLQHFDVLCRQSVQWGPLRVPALGANTVRSEFAFLSGMPQDLLGAHRFNPYAMVAKGYPIPSLPLYLKKLGYTTLCLHPYKASYYRRKKVFKHWGFDAFLDIKHFSKAKRFGPFTTDVEVARAAMKQLRQNTGPLFIFAITMENHGPLHMETVRPKDVQALYHQAPQPGHEELTAYLRHLRHADKMLHLLHTELNQNHQPASMCWFGDHVPIMPMVYATQSEAITDTRYVLWNNGKIAGPSGTTSSPLPIHELAQSWLMTTGLYHRP